MDITSFILGFKKGAESGGGGSQTTEFIPTTTFTNEYISDIGVFAYFLPLEASAMETWMANRKPVTVVYDGEEYVLTPQVVTGADGSDGVCVGNLSAFGGTGNEEPFAVVPWYIEETHCFLIGSTVDTAPTEHTIRIYQEASGGGTVPSGLYMKTYDATFPQKFGGKMYEMNGKTYLILGHYESGNVCTWYELSDGAFVSVLASTTWDCKSMEGFRPLVLDGKIHCFELDRKKHFTFDPTTWTRTDLSDLPAKSYKNYCCIYNGTLIVYCSDDKGLYEWDKTTDTWTLKATISGTYSMYCTPWVINGELYLLSNNRWYHYDNGTIAEVGTMNYTPSVEVGVKENWFYYVYSKNPHIVYKYDVVNGQEKKVGRIPYAKAISVCYSEIQNDNFKLCFSDHTISSYCAEIIEVEE